MNKVEQVQYQASLAITGTWKGTNMNNIYEELGWESLTDRRWLMVLLLIIYKILFPLPKLVLAVELIMICTRNNTKQTDI